MADVIEELSELHKERQTRLERLSGLMSSSKLIKHIGKAGLELMQARVASGNLLLQACAAVNHTDQ